MRGLVAIFLIAVFAYVIAGHSILLSALIQKTKHQVFDQLEKEAFPKNTIALTFKLQGGKVADPEFSSEEDLEFMFRGQMFDIVKQEVHDNTITYYCIQDEQETNLKEMLAGIHLPEKKGQPFQNLLHLIKSLLQDYSLNQFDSDFFNQTRIALFSISKHRVTQFLAPRVTQPPEL